MEEKKVDLRKILSMNIKKHREELGISQEKLAEKAGISANMIKDIEGCRTWVSDNTVVKLASALETDIYRLFVSSAIQKDEVSKVVIADLVKILQNIRKEVDFDFDKAIKSLGGISGKKK